MLNFCDRLFLSHYGEAEFRASLPAGILFFTLVCGFMALAGFTNTFVAQFWGAGDRAGCARATAQGILFALISFPLIMLLTPAGLWMLRLGGHGAEVLALEEEYFRILMWCGGGMTLSSALSSFFSGRGLTLVIMNCNIIANGINILLNYLLIFGKWLRGASLILIVLNGVFIFAISSALARGLDIECGCFTLLEAGAKVGLLRIAEDILLLGMSVWVFIRAGVPIQKVQPNSAAI